MPLVLTEPWAYCCGFLRKSTAACLCMHFDSVLHVDQAGMVSSGNSLDYTEQDMTFMTSNKVAVKEMEAAGVAWVAAMFKAPMFCLKSITDIVDGELRH